MARFFRRGVSKIRFLPAVVVLAAPTAPEIAGGTDLTPQIAAISGFELANSPIETPDLNGTFSPQINGEDKTSASKLTFYDDDAASTIRTALAKGTKGFILFEPYGTASTKRAEVWPVTSTGVNDAWSTGNEAAKFDAAFAVTATPVQTAVLP